MSPKLNSHDVHPRDALFAGEKPFPVIPACEHFAGSEKLIAKALGTGARGLAWREIEILPNRRGKPLVYLHGRAKQRAETIGLRGVDVSLTHSRELANAVAVVDES